VLVKEWRLLQRAVFVIGREDRIVYTDYVADQMAEPAYDAALAAARAAVDAPQAEGDVAAANDAR
jgi:thiol peroxidase